MEKYSDKDYPAVIYPGPLFPNNISELEKLHCGGFYFIENWNLKYIPLEIFQTFHVNLEVKDKSANEVTEMLEKEIQHKKLNNAIVTIRLQGKLSKGKQSDVDFKKIFSLCYAAGAYFVMKNTAKLESVEFEAVMINQNSVEDIEETLIQEHAGQQTLFKERMGIVKDLMKVFSQEKDEGERSFDFERRIFDEAEKVVKGN